MREALREVAEKLAGGRLDLLRVEADVVRERERALRDLGRLVDATELRERLCEPERTRDERAFLVVLAVQR